jgi:hypothetical protein
LAQVAADPLGRSQEAQAGLAALEAKLAAIRQVAASAGENRLATIKAAEEEVMKAATELSEGMQRLSQAARCGVRCALQPGCF